MLCLLKESHVFLIVLVKVFKYGAPMKIGAFGFLSLFYINEACCIKVGHTVYCNT